VLLELLGIVAIVHKVDILDIQVHLDILDILVIVRKVVIVDIVLHQAIPVIHQLLVTVDTLVFRDIVVISLHLDILDILVIVRKVATVGIVLLPDTVAILECLDIQESRDIVDFLDIAQ
jgi:hypothetical protein